MSGTNASMIEPKPLDRTTTGKDVTDSTSALRPDGDRTSRSGAPAPSTHHLDVLWRAHWDDPTRESRNALVLAYQPLVRGVVGRLPSTVRSSWESCDLESFGLLGLIEAIDRFNAGSEPIRFPNYARQRIRGAIFDELRGLDWLPRSVRNRTSTYRNLADELASELGRIPAANEVVEQMGLSPAVRTSVLYEVQSAQLIRFRREADSDSGSTTGPVLEQLLADPVSDPGVALLATEQLGELHDAIARLDDRSRAVLQLRYFEDKSQSEIGAMLGITNSRVCQIESSAVRALRSSLQRREVAVGA